MVHSKLDNMNNSNPIYIFLVPHRFDILERECQIMRVGYYKFQKELIRWTENPKAIYRVGLEGYLLRDVNTFANLETVLDNAQ